MRTLLLILLTSVAGFAQVVNKATSLTYADFNSAFTALADGGSNVTLEVYGPLSASAVLSKNFNGLTIVGVGQPTLDCNQADGILAFNGTGKTLQNITIDNFRIINNNPVTTSAAALRFTTVVGQNVIRRCTFSGCSIPVRATTACGDFLVEDCVAIGYTMGVFRFGLGSVTGTNPNVADMGAMVFRRCYFDASSNNSAEADIVAKRMTSFLEEDCIHKNASKYATSIYDPAMAGTGIIRRNQYLTGHAKATTGGTIDLAPNVTTGTGSSQSWLIDSNVFDGDKGPMIAQLNGQSIAITNNSFIEGTGNAGNLVSLTTSKNFTTHVNNLYIANSTNTNAFVNLGTMAYESGGLASNYNIYYKTNGRALIQGTTTGTYSQTLTAYAVSTYQAKGLELNSLNTLPTFNTTLKKYSAYYLAPGSVGQNAGTTSYPQSQAPASGATLGASQDIGAYTNRYRRYRTGRIRITKTS